nr:hypothetical protein BaRGS_031204 [Batillaria attramentaria]
MEGIQAQDLSSLLEQFEEVSQSLDGIDFPKVETASLKSKSLPASRCCQFHWGSTEHSCAADGGKFRVHSWWCLVGHTHIRFLKVTVRVTASKRAQAFTEVTVFSLWLIKEFVCIKVSLLVKVTVKITFQISSSKEERKIVYVGRIPESYTRKDLRKRFERFGQIEDVSVHFREAGDNYGFVTFFYTCDAYAAIDKGNDDPNEMKFDLCFGGRRHFCANDYADLDGNLVIEEEYTPIPSKDPVGFDELLKQAQQKLKKKW